MAPDLRLYAPASAQLFGADTAAPQLAERLPPSGAQRAISKTIPSTALGLQPPV